MDAPPSDRYARVRDSLLHIGLRQITEEPSSDQPANFARRRARFKEYRQKLDDYRARQRAAGVAAEERVDSELRARLDGVNKRSIGCSARQAPRTSGIAEESSKPLTESRDKMTTVPSPVCLQASSSGPTRLETTMPREHPSGQQTTKINTLEPGGHANSTTTSPSSSATSITAPDNVHTRTAASPGDSPSRLNRSAFQSANEMSTSTEKSTDANLVDRTKPRRINTTSYTPSVTSTPLSSSTLGQSRINTENVVKDNLAHHAASVVSSPSTICRKAHSHHTLLVHETGGSSHTEVEDSDAKIEVARDNNGSGNSRLNEESENDNPASDTEPAATHPGCTSKHFRVRCITGRNSIDGDTYYIVSWKSSWVPSDQIITSEDGQDRHIKIDGRDWLIAETIKRKVKKGVHKQLVRWVDDTLEPIKRLRRVLPAIREFELKPRLDRRVVSFDESSFDRTKILPQSDEEFREAQVHLAKKWPMIEPRNDIDLLPAFRQIMMEIFPRPEDDNLNRKTHQRLIDLPQRRRLRWSEEYLLAGRFYENTLPRRNALLLQVVAEVADGGCCERCVSDTAPFRECARDTSEESPWFNGGCANCGAAEANSTCCHHRVGTAHLERGRSSGLNSERLRELIDPTRSISLLSNLEYESDGDSDTFSADSYAESDNSSLCQRETADDDLRSTGHIDFDDHDGDSIDNDFWTPNSPADDTSNSAQSQSATNPDFGRNELSPARSAHPSGLSRAPNGVLVRKRFMSKDAAAFPTPAVTQANRFAAAICSSTHASHARVRKETTPIGLDRSSMRLAAESSISKLFCDNTQDDHADDGSSESYLHFNHHDVHSNDEFTGAHGRTSQVLSTRARASPKPTIATNSSPAVVQSVEAFVQRSSTYLGDHAAATTEILQVPSATRNGKKRAASRPSAHQRASNRPSTDSSRSYHGASRDSAVSTESHRPGHTSANGATESVTETKIDRGHTHEGCRVNWPCVDPDHVTPDTGALVAVYRDKIDPSRSFTLGEVLYILSRCTCHWASAFSKVWDGWREESNTPEDAELTKPQFLLTVWPEFLLEAARECCPSDPTKRVTITID